MPIERWHRALLWVEGGILAAAAPLLIFPSVVRSLTIVALILLVGGWLGRWWLTGRPLPVTPFNGVMLVWAVMVGVSILVTADPDLTWPKAMGLILGLAVWRYLAIFVENERRLWLTVAGYMILGVGLTFVGAISTNWQIRVPFIRDIFWVLPPQLLSLPGQVGEGVHTNQLAGTLLFFIPLAMALLAGWRPPRRRFLFVVLAAGLNLFLLVVLLITQSRSGWLAASGGYVALLVLAVSAGDRYARWRWPLALALLFLLLIVVALVGSQWPIVAETLRDPPDTTTPIGPLSSLAFRYEVWQWAIAAVQDFSFTGTGLGTFRRVVVRLYPIAYAEDIAHAHNVFLQVALDTGLLGLVAYLAMIMVAISLAWQVARRVVHYRALALGLLAGLVAFHIYGLTDALAPGSKPGIALWMVIGMLSGLSQLRGTTEGVSANG